MPGCCKGAATPRDRSRSHNRRMRQGATLAVHNMQRPLRHRIRGPMHRVNRFPTTTGRQPLKRVNKHRANPEVLGKSGTRRTRRAIQLRRPRCAARNTSGPLLPSRRCARRRPVAPNLQGWKDRLAKAANLSRIGVQSFGTLWRLQRPQIIAGRRPIGAISRRDCISLQSSDGESARS